MQKRLRVEAEVDTKLTLDLICLGEFNKIFSVMEEEEKEKEEGEGGEIKIKGSCKKEKEGAC